MAATDATARFIDYLVTLPDSEIIPGKVAPEIEELTIALSKLHYYCGMETIKKCIEVAEAFSLSAGEIAKAKLESLFLAGDMKGIDINLSNLQAMNDRLNAQILAATQVNPQDPQIALWRRQSAELYGQSSEFYRKKGELELAKYRATEKCRDVMIDRLRRLYDLQVELLILARRELEFNIPESAYRQLMQANSQKMFAKTNEMIGEIRAQVNKKLGGAQVAETAAKS